MGRMKEVWQEEREQDMLFIAADEWEEMLYLYQQEYEEEISRNARITIGHEPLPNDGNDQNRGNPAVIRGGEEREDKVLPLDSGQEGICY